MTATVQMPAMTDAEYYAAGGLSNSGMKDLLVSPLRFWYRHIRPDREPEEPTPAMVFGSALHCAVLQPYEFDKRYVCAVSPGDHPGVLTTIDEIREWCRDKGHPAKGTRKDNVIEWAKALDKDVPILQVIEAQHYAQNVGKTILSVEDWERLAGAAKALLDEPRVQEILAKGQAEVPYFYKDDSGVVLKAKMDWVTPKLTVDLKTFVQQRGKSIDRTIADALLYEGYLRQAVFYEALRGLVDGNKWSRDFVFCFVESDPPHETRIKVLRPKTGGNANLYWERSRIEIAGCIELYKECMDRFGDKPWRYAQEITPLQDEDIPALSYAA